MERWNAGTAKYIGHFYKLPVWKIKTINNNIRHFYDILIFCLYLFDCQSVIMPALFPPFAQKSTAHKSQNLYKAIYRSALYLSTLLIFSTMNTSQIRFVLALHATWNVLRDPVLTRIYARKWKRALAQLSKTIAPSDRLPSLYGYVFRLMYAECKKYV